MNYQHLSQAERYQIYVLMNSGHNQKQADQAHSAMLCDCTLLVVVGAPVTYTIHTNQQRFYPHHNTGLIQPRFPIRPL